MKVYAVGGSVRDTLMGMMPHDRDYVVTGASHEDMIAANFVQIGKSFPVYLHPDTGEEYALPRKEIKTGSEHTDFEVSVEGVTLEDDLLRRDFTMNAIAQELDTGKMIDPYGGVRDIENRIIRHVSDAFSEDALRIFRAARFAAKTGFEIDPSTMELCKKIVASREIEKISMERIGQEFTKVVICGGNAAFVYFEILQEMGVLDFVHKMMKDLTPKYYITKAFPDDVGINSRFALFGYNVANPEMINEFLHECKLSTNLRRVTKAGGILGKEFSVESVFEVFMIIKILHDNSLHDAIANMLELADIDEWVKYLVMRHKYVNAKYSTSYLLSLPHNERSGYVDEYRFAAMKNAVEKI